MSIYKPATSKSGNSEHYTVCTGFTGLPPPVAAAYARLDDARSARGRPVLAFADLPVPFLRKIASVASLGSFVFPRTAQRPQAHRYLSGPCPSTSRTPSTSTWRRWI